MSAAETFDAPPPQAIGVEFPEYQPTQGDWSSIDWRDVPKDVAVEMLRQAELRMEATDRVFRQGRQRALDFIRTFMTLSVLLIGAFFATALDDAIRVAALGGALSLIAAIVFAWRAMAPRAFNLAGCEARYWIPDLKRKKTLTAAIGEQAASLDEQQVFNDRVIAEMSANLERGLRAVIVAPIIALAFGLFFADPILSALPADVAAAPVAAAPSPR